jgi:hypothetical protein
MKTGDKVWCRPRIIDDPIEAVYLRKITPEERKAGYRNGHLVEINGEETWCRIDLCSLNKEDIRDLI